ncbi:MULTISPECIES: hypothetical protein [Micromonospora]|uniref:hypothetical protein n=1 Tax=Micromonospora TaxID=1873 RepID=UPI00137522B5|nr:MULTISPECIES: hypothetical protein [unclassified Micromonospora]MBM0225965.1 hypothetical protein [Micromonospora sp. ATA51]
MRFVIPASESGSLARVVDRILTVATTAVLPVIAWVVARLLAPNYFTMPDRRTRITVVVIVTAVTVIGYPVGRFNDRFLTCGDFRSPAMTCRRTAPKSPVAR